jgi:UDP-3-O-[3-hydroxymyristoyl] glucosamine N-acyltransferase
MINLYDIIKFIEEKEEVNLFNIKSKVIDRVINDINKSSEDAIMWLNEKNFNLVKKIESGTIICGRNSDINDVSNNISLIIVDNPRLTFSSVLREFFYSKIIHKIQIELPEDVIIGKNINISKGTIIEEDVEIGENTYIGYNNVILKGTKIGKNVIIGNNNTIGGDGFGYEKNSNGDYDHIPHIGNVIIEDNVEIGNNNCIDRAVIGSTMLRKNSKIDNLVHIAHGVEIGENSLIIANSMIAGSTTVGQNTWIGPSTSIINKCKIGSNSMTGIGTVVVKSIENNELHIGVPSKKLRNI